MSEKEIVSLTPTTMSGKRDRCSLPCTIFGYGERLGDADLLLDTVAYVSSEVKKMICRRVNGRFKTIDRQRHG